ncbi:hypothetical protein DFH09DRAFT_1302977 [Mycena vulgaris]|nr:hypothetical protein DFH09DRAFT_1302977 [Mycena vulgaris]
MREHLTQMQLKQDARFQPMTPPRIRPCARDGDAPMFDKNSTGTPSRSRLWLASLLNPAAGAEFAPHQPRAPPCPAAASTIPNLYPPSATPSCPSLLSPASTAVGGERTLAAVRALFPAPLAFAAPAPVLASLQETVVTTPRGPALAPIARQDTGAPRILHPAADPFLSSAIQTRLRPLPAGLRPRGAWARRPAYARAQMV